MLKFLAGMVLGGILAMYPALAYPEQLHSAIEYVGLGSLLPSTDSKVPDVKLPDVEPLKS